MLVDARDGHIAGMLSMLPVTLSSGGQDYAARYIYAVATHPSYRNQGVSSALLHAAHTYMQSRGEAASVLVPASSGLFAFYGNRGYKTAFYLDVVRIHAALLPPFPKDGRFSPCSQEDYVRFRDEAFMHSSLYAKWDEKAVAYAISSLGSSGGVIRLSWPGGHGCAAWETALGGVLVRELAVTTRDVLTALAVLHKALNAEQYTIRLPQGSHSGAQTLPFGMIKWLTEEPELKGSAPYLSLALD